MRDVFEAVIFDMDGVLVDSEPLWRKAMIKGFADKGILITEDECRKTQGTRFREVVLYWLDRHKREDLRAPELEHEIVEHLLDLIRKEGRCMEGIPELIQFCISKHLRIGLATSSSHVLMNTVLDTLGLKSYFNAAISAEFMPHGKPHPEVFLSCADALGVKPQACLVIEDSVNGVVAAKAAQMTAVAVPDPDHSEMRQFALADYQVKRSSDLISLFKSLFL